jgi:hypothetical protein
MPVARAETTSADTSATRRWGQLGEIAEQWVNRDELGMLIELGVVASADESK